MYEYHTINSTDKIPGYVWSEGTAFRREEKCLRGMKSSPSKNLKTSKAPGSVSGDVEMDEELVVVALGDWDLTKITLAFHAAA